MRLIWGGKKAAKINKMIGGFVANIIWGDDRGFEDFTSMGVVSHETLIAGVVYHNYNPWDGVIELSAAATSAKWLTREVITQMYGYPLTQLDCRMAVHRSSERNNISEIFKRFGCRQYQIDDLRGPDEAEIISTLTKAQWKTNKYNKDASNG